MLNTGIPRFGHTGTFLGFIGSCIDIHDLHQARNEIQALHDRLSVAMDETNHRVRNNLQIISSMLDTTLMEYGSDMMPTSQARRLVSQISTLSAVHDLLAERFKLDQESAGLVSGRDLLEHLLPWLERLLPKSRIKHDINEFWLPTRQATALSLVVNELTANAARFGNGTVNITCGVDGQSVVLNVEDDGAGFPSGFDAEDSGKIGLALVGTLVRHDLGGTVKLANREQFGGSVTVRFPLAGL